MAPITHHQHLVKPLFLLLQSCGAINFVAIWESFINKQTYITFDDFLGDVEVGLGYG
jgi:hypothetical protein